MVLDNILKSSKRGIECQKDLLKMLKKFESYAFKYSTKSDRAKKRFSTCNFRTGFGAKWDLRRKCVFA